MRGAGSPDQGVSPAPFAPVSHTGHPCIKSHTAATALRASAMVTNTR